MSSSAALMTTSRSGRRQNVLLVIELKRARPTATIVPGK
jgi:hypothetical protein